MLRNLGFYKFLLKLFFAMIQETKHHVRHPSVQIKCILQ